MDCKELSWCEHATDTISQTTKEVNVMSSQDSRGRDRSRHIGMNASITRKGMKEQKHYDKSIINGVG